MAVRVSKPEFNLKEKISELDYSQIPYEKMPIGSVIQVKQNYVTSQTVYGSTNSATELFGVDISPRSKTSGFLVTVHVSYSHDLIGSDNADSRDIFLFLKRDDDYIGANTNLTRSFGYTNNNGWYKTDVPFSNDSVTHTWQYDTLAQDIQYLDQGAASSLGTTIRYGLYMMCQNNFNLNRSNQNTANGGTSFITVQEIK